jgi:signal transduction histidine kinase
MSESLDYAAAMARLARVLVPEQADGCAVDVLEGGDLKNLAVASTDPAKVEFVGELQKKLSSRFGDVVNQATAADGGQSLLLSDISADLLPESAPDTEALVALRAQGVRSAMSVPIRARGATLGVLTLMSTQSARTYDMEDLALAQELGRRAGIAIENGRAYKEARDAIRLREEFLSVAGHELKTPLTALLLQLQSLQGAFASGIVEQNIARWGERMAKAVAQARRLERLVNELLDVSRITLGPPILEREEMDLAVLVAEVVERHAAELARARSTVAVEQSGRTSGVWDRGRLDQVVTNLISNAIKYGSGKPIHVSVSGDDEFVKLAVRDEGIGIRVEDHPRIFGRFERAVSDRHYGGFGLGLWIVRELIEAHGGRVGFESRPGAGSTFVVELPPAAAGKT